MPCIWDKGIFGLVYHGRMIDLTSKVDYITPATRIIIFRKSGGITVPGRVEESWLLAFCRMAG